jgi:uncharacterized membrane protein YbhN (UPF0104 family)
MKNFIKYFFLITITISVIYYLYYANLINLKEIEILVVEKYDYIIYSLFFYLISLCISIFRYQYIIKKFGVKIEYKILLQMQIIGTFFSQTLPFSTLSSEIFKIYFISNFYKIKEWNKITFITIYDKAIGLSSFFLLSFFISIFLINFQIKFSQNLNLLVSIATLVFALICFFIPKFLNVIEFKNFNYDFKYGKEIIISLVSSFLFCISYFLIVLLANLEISLYQVILIMPFLILSFILPIGIAGIGGYQIIAIYLFSFFIENKNLLVSVSIIFASILLVVNFILGLYFILKNFNIIKNFFNLKSKK